MTLCKIILYILLCTSIICGIICFLINIYCKKESFVPNKKVVIKSPSAAAPQNSNVKLNTKLWKNTDNKNYPEIVNPNDNFLLRSPNINNTSISMSGNIEGLKGYYSALKDMFYQDAEEYVSSKGDASIFYTIYSFGKISAPDKDYLQYKFPDLAKNMNPETKTLEQFLNPPPVLTSNKLSDYGLEQKYPICINNIHSSDFIKRNTSIVNTYYQPIYNPFYISTKTIKTDISEDIRERPYEITPLYTGIGYNLKSTKYSIYQTPLTVKNLINPNFPYDHHINKYGVSVENTTKFIRFFKNEIPIPDGEYQVTVYYNPLINSNPSSITLNLNYIKKIADTVESSLNENTKITKFFVRTSQYITILDFDITNVRLFSFIVQRKSDYDSNNNDIILTSQSPIITPYSLLSSYIIGKYNECFISYPWITSSLDIYPNITNIKCAHFNSTSKTNNYFQYDFLIEIPIFPNMFQVKEIEEDTYTSIITTFDSYLINVTNKKLKIISGNGIGEQRDLKQNLYNKFFIFVPPYWDVVPDTTSWFQIISGDNPKISFSKENNTDYIYRTNINPMKIENDFYIGSYLKETASFNGQLNLPFILTYNELNMLQQQSLSNIIQSEIEYNFWTQNIGTYKFDYIIKNFKPEYDDDIYIRKQKLIDSTDNDPLNLISLFRRGVKKIICFIPIRLVSYANDEDNFCKVFAPLFKFYFDHLIFKTNKSKSYLYTNCQIEDCDEDCKQQLIYLYKLMVKTGVYSTINYGNMTLTILKNESFGILETYQVNILFVSETITSTLFSNEIMEFIKTNLGKIKYIVDQDITKPFICKQNLLNIKNDIDTIFMNPNVITQPDLHFDGKDYNTIMIYNEKNIIIDKTGFTDSICNNGVAKDKYNLGFSIDKNTNTILCHSQDNESWFYANTLLFVLNIPRNIESIIDIISINSGGSYLKCFLNVQTKLCVECNVIISYNIDGTPNYKKSIIQIPFYIKTVTIVTISYQNNILKLKSFTKYGRLKNIILYKEIPLYSLCSQGNINTKLYYNDNTYIIGEIIQYNKVLKDDEILSVEKYLSHKWNLDIMCIYAPVFYFDSTKQSGNKFTEDISGNNNICPLDVSKVELKISNNVLEGNLPYEIKNFTLGITFVFAQTGTDIRLLNFNNISVLISGGNKFKIQNGTSTILESEKDISFMSNIPYTLFLSASQDSIEFTFLDLSSYRKIYLQKSDINYTQKTILPPIIGVEPSLLQNPTKSIIGIINFILYDKYLNDEDINKIICKYNLSIPKVEISLPFLDFIKYENIGPLKIIFNECDKDNQYGILKVNRKFFTENMMYNTTEFTFILVVKINKLNEGSNMFKIFNEKNEDDYLVIKNSTGIYKDTIRFQNGNIDEQLYMCNLPKIEDVKNIFIARIKGTELYFEQITSVNKVPKIVQKIIMIADKIKKQSLRKIQIGDDNIDIDLFQIIAYDRALYDFEINKIKNNLLSYHKFYP